MNFKLLMLLFLAGGTGTLCRYLLHRGVAGKLGLFPWNTLAVNVLGCFLAGVFFFYLKDRLKLSETTANVILVGFFGAFTTFSTYALETVRLGAEGNLGKMAANFLLQNLLTIAAVYGAYCLYKK